MAEGRRLRGAVAHAQHQGQSCRRSVHKTLHLWCARSAAVHELEKFRDEQAATMKQVPLHQVRQAEGVIRVHGDIYTTECFRRQLLRVMHVYRHIESTPAAVQ